MSSHSEKKSFLFPPGGLMMWILVVMELLVFGMALIIFLYMRKNNLEIFMSSQKELNQGLATINTIVLVTSGYLVVLAQDSYLHFKKTQVVKLLCGASFLGVVFLFIKILEYAEKINAGLSMGYNTFFDFYWALTAFHAVHVFLGVLILLYFSYGISKDKTYPDDFNINSAAIYWHMCDLIWMILFPIIYIL